MRVKLSADLPNEFKILSRDVVSVSTSRSRDGLETYRRSRLGLVSGMEANVSVSSRSRELRSRSWPRSRQFRSRAQVPANHIFWFESLNCII